MGGKTKQSQRTKNNVRPSSSGRSAELLSNTIKVDTSSGKTLPVLFPTLTTTNIDQGLSPEYSVCFKKLNKKDPVTKTKALQELTELTKNSNVEESVAALPSWAHYYQTLTIDTDRRVREATQACHGALMSACGRHVAPQLRRLLPAWLLAYHDDHAPAGSLARVHLQSTFPDKKFGDAISFCKSDIMSLIIDNLTGKAETMLSKKIEDAEEREIQTTRVLSSSLCALELFFTKLPETHDDWLWDTMATLLHSNAFWKLAAHNSERVRTSWYGLVGRMWQRVGARLSREQSVRALRALLARPERAAAAATRWAALLLLVHHVQDWHTLLDKKDLLIKRLLDVLENGGWGEAQLLSNILLPLLTKLPDDLVTKDFFVTFFKAIFTGLNNKHLLSSKSERKTWINNLAEYLRFLSIQQYDYVIEVVTYVHRIWLENIFAIGNVEVKSNLIKHSATNMASLLKYWLKQTNENGEKFDQLIRNFWQNIGATLSTQINKLSVQKDDIIQSIETNILFLKSLNAAFMQEGKKKQHIQFEDQKVEDVDVTPLHLTEQCDVTLVERFKHNLNKAAENTCCNYFELASEKQVSQAVFPSLITLIEEFGSKNLLIAVARHFNLETIYGLYDKVLRGWLAGDTMRCKALLDIVFILIKYLTEEEQNSVFNSFQQFPPSVVEWCLSLTLPAARCGDSAARRWLRSSVADAGLVALSCREQDPRAASLLLACLAHTDHGEMMVSEGAVAAVVDMMCASLRLAVAMEQDVVERGPSGSGALERNLPRAAALVGALAPCAHRRLLEPLLLELFRITLDYPLGSPHVSEGAWRAACEAWRGARAVLPARSALARLHAHVHCGIKELDIERIEHVTSLCRYILVSSENSSMRNISEIVSLTKHLFDIKTKKPKVPLEVFALRCDCIHGNINCPFDNDNEYITQVVNESDKEYTELTKKDLMIYVYNSLFRTFFMRAIITKNDSSDEEDEETIEFWSDVLLKEDYFIEKLNLILYEYVVLHVLYERYAFWPHYEIIQQAKERMESLIEDILSEVTPETKEIIQTHLSEKAATKGYYWSYAKRIFDVKMHEIAEKIRSQNQTPESQTSDDRTTSTQLMDDRVAEENALSDDFRELESDSGDYESVLDILQTSKLEDIVTGSGFFHSLQASSKWSAHTASYRSEYVVMLRSVYCAHAHEPALLERLALDVAASGADCSADAIVIAYYNHNHVMLYETDLSAAPWSQVVSNAAVARYLSAAVRARGWRLGAQQWDFTTISLCSLAASLRLSAHRWDCTKVAIIAQAVFELFTVVHDFIANVRSEAEKRQPSAHVIALPKEWEDIFAPDLNKHFFQLLMIILESGDKSMTASRVSVLGALVAARGALRWESAPACLRCGELSLQALCAGATAALQRVSHCAYKYLAYAALQLLAKPLVLDDAEKLAAWSAREDESPRPEFSLALYDDTMLQLQELVNAALSNVKVCEGTCEMVAASDSHSVTLGYLLLAAALLRHCELARGDLAQFYIELLRVYSYADLLMASCVRLLPAAVLAAALDAAPREPLPERYLRHFQDPPALDVYQRCDGAAVSALACGGVALALGGALAGEARGWCGALGAGGAAALRRLVRAAVAPPLRARHLLQLRQRAHELPDAQVTVHWARGEASCALALEERVLELTVHFADEHPLVPPAVRTPPTSPAPDTHWIVLYLSYQNGTLLNAFKMWISAVTTRVESARPCYICYCRMHPVSGRLPGALCHQCRNKFHSPCLRRWFSSSNKSNCPLCRTKF